MKLSPLTAGLFCVLAALNGAVAQTAPAPSPTKPPLLSTTVPDGTKYPAMPGKLDSCSAQVAAIKGKSCGVIFIGDSITAGWLGPGRAVWEKFYGSRHALDFGVSGDQTQHVLWRLENMDVRNLHPRVAVILIGTNNTGYAPPQIADGVKAVIARTQAMYPGVKIILVSIMPNRRAQEKMMATNAIIRNFADGKTIYYLDLVPLMPPTATVDATGKSVPNWKGLSPDGLHPDASGYQLWAEAMEPVLTKLLAAPRN